MVKNILKKKEFKKIRASLTPNIALLMSVILFVSAVTIDYSRIRLSKVFIEESCTNALNIALLDYDETLCNRFSLMAVNDLDAIEASIEKTLSATLESDKASHFYNFEVVSIALTFDDAPLINPKVLKHMIIEQHSKAFMVDKATDWLERLNAFKSLSQITHLIEEFTEILEKVAELEKKHSVLQKHYEDFEKWRKYFKDRNINDLISEIRTLEEEIEEVEKEISVLKKEHKKENSTDIAAGYLAEKSKLSRQKRVLKKALKQVESQIDKILSGTKTVEKLSEAIADFSEHLGWVSLEIESFIERLPEASTDKFGIEFNKMTEGVKEVLQKTLRRLKNGSTLLGAQVERLGKLNRCVSDLAEDIKNALSGAIKLVSSDRIVKSISNQIKRVVIDIFKETLGLDSSVGFSSVLKALWQMTLGSALKQVGYDYGEIPDDVYRTLPSRVIDPKAIPEFIELEGTIAHDKTESEMNTEILQSTQKSGSMLEKMLGSLLNFGDHLLQKMVIVDYINSHFTSNDYSDKKAMGNDYIPDTEVEYILQGSRFGNSNVLKTELTIYGIRFLMNSASLLAFKQDKLSMLSTEIAALTGGVSYPVVYGLLLAGWSGIESYLDITTIKNNSAVKLFKMNNDIRVDLSLEKIINIGETLSHYIADAKKVQHKKSPLDMGYVDYLFFLLVIQDEETQLYRILDVLSLSNDLKEIQIMDMQTALKLTVGVSVNTWFTHVFKGDKSFYYNLTYTRGY